MVDAVVTGVGVLVVTGAMIGMIVAYRRGALLTYNALLFGVVFGLSGAMVAVETVRLRLMVLLGYLTTDRSWLEDVVSTAVGVLFVVGGVFSVRVGLAIMKESRETPKPHWGPPPRG